MCIDTHLKLHRNSLDSDAQCPSSFMSKSCSKSTSISIYPHCPCFKIWKRLVCASWKPYHQQASIIRALLIKYWISGLVLLKDNIQRKKEQPVSSVSFFIAKDSSRWWSLVSGFDVASGKCLRHCVLSKRNAPRPRLQITTAGLLWICSPLT